MCENLPENNSLIVEGRFARLNDPERCAGGTVIFW
jgi:hypothetical protein